MPVRLLLALLMLAVSAPSLFAQDDSPGLAPDTSAVPPDHAEEEADEPATGIGGVHHTQDFRPPPSTAPLASGDIELRMEAESVAHQEPGVGAGQFPG
ncbi:MAG: hypothetical protein R3E50_14520 [Halioglobus sp.]